MKWKLVDADNPTAHHRIGWIVEFELLQEGLCCAWVSTENNKTTITSVVQSVIDDDDIRTIKTNNTTYTFKKEK